MYWQRFKTPLQKFEEKVTKSINCWEWNACLDSGGYGQMYFNGRNRKAHAIAKFLYDGFPLESNSLKVGLQWDHKCRNHKCVRPDHLELVSRKVNVNRGISPAAINKQKQFCPKGHDLSKNAMPGRLKRHGGRSCYICHKDRAKKYWANRKTK
jgi:hypothetical protein